MASEIDQMIDSLIDKLVEARHEDGVTQRELGERIGVPATLISKWEAKIHLPRLDSLQHWVQALGWPNLSTVLEEVGM